MLGSIVGGALGLAGNLLGGSGETESAPVETPFDQLPKDVRDDYLKAFLPAARDEFEDTRPYSPYPLVRVDAPQDVFDPIGLYELQNVSDAMGGMFRAPNIAEPTQSQGTQPLPANIDDIVAGLQGLGVGSGDDSFGLSVFNQGSTTPLGIPLSSFAGYGGYGGTLSADDLTALGRLESLSGDDLTKLMSGQVDDDVLEALFGGLDRDNINSKFGGRL